MTFLNPLLLLGLAAVAIPIAIHLIAKREPKRIVFGSIGFLAKKVESSRTRMRVRRYWLLAMRILAIAAFAMALALPAVASSFSGLWWIVGILALIAAAILATATWMGSKGHVRKTILPLLGLAAAALLAAFLTGGYAVAQSQLLIGASFLGPAVTAEGPVAVGIVIDNGPAAAYRDDSENHLERMKAMVRKITAALPRTSRVALVERSPVPPAFAIDASAAVKRADSLDIRQLPTPLASRIESTRRLLMTSDLPAKHLIVLTGRSKTSWRSLSDSSDSSSPDERATSRDEPAASETNSDLGDASAGDPVSLHIVDTGDMTRTNVSLSPLRLTDPFPPAGSTVPISATVSVSRNTFNIATESTRQSSNGDAEPQPPLRGPSESDGDLVSVTAELQWFDDDASLPVIRDGELIPPSVSAVDRASFQIPVGGSADLVLSAPAMAPGIHHGQLRLTGQDSMPLDDVRYVTLQVPKPADLLIVSDDPDEGYVMEQTIQASSLSMSDVSNGGNGPMPKYRIATIESSDLAVARLSDFVAVILLDPSPKAIEQSSLDEYVATGGSVLSILGPRMTTSLKSNWMPDRKRIWRMGDDPTFFNVVRSGNGIATALGGDVPWNLYPVHRYWQIEDSVDAGPRPWDVLIRYAGTGHAALLSRDLSISLDGNQQNRNAGKILVMTTPLPALGSTTRSWNELFGGDPWPAWILVRKLVDDLAFGNRPSLNLKIGKPLIVSHDDIFPSDAEATSRLLWYRPDQSTAVPLDRSAETPTLIIANHDHAGMHWIRGDGMRVGYSINLESDATALDQIASDRMPRVPGFAAQEVLESIDDLKLSSESGAGRTPLKSPILLLALSAFLIEQYLGNRFYGKPSNGKTSIGKPNNGKPAKSS